MLACWSIYYFAYFGLQYSMTWMGTVIWLNFTLFGLIELVGIYMGTRLLKEFKLFVKPMRWLLFFAGIACLIFQDQNSTSFLLAVLCSLKSCQIVNYFVLPNFDDLYFGGFSNQTQGTGFHLEFFCWEDFNADYAFDFRVHQ